MTRDVPDLDDREVLVEHDAIESWANERGGHPVRGGDDADASIGFTFEDDRPDDRVGWETFFERFETAGLALVVNPDGDAYEVVDRSRVVETDDESEEARDRRQRERERARQRRLREVTDEQAQQRENRAEEAENVDAHRDEEPYMS